MTAAPMRVLRDDDTLPASPGSAVTIGVYDGVHRGHQWLLRRLRQTSGDALPVVVVTFHPHPLQVLRPVAAPRLLTDLDLKLRLLSASGAVDACLVVSFDTDRQMQSAEDFVADVLVNQLHARHVLVGTDFRFGRDRQGDLELLRDLGSASGFRADGLPLLPVRPSTAHIACSSTYIRGLVAAGDVQAAARLLGRPHEVAGAVVGTSRPIGRGTPTVVVRVDAYRALPTEGSYAGWLITQDGRRHTAGVSVRQGITAREQALLDVHVVDGVSPRIHEAVRVELTRRVWTSDRGDLVAEMATQAEQFAQAWAVGGWGSAS